MSNLSRALDALLSAGTDHGAEAAKARGSQAESVIPPEQLSGISLVQAVCIEGEPSVGSPTSGFAYFEQEADILMVVSADLGKIKHVSLERAMTEHAMATAQDLGASFLVHGAQVICNIQGFSQAGDSYGEAALRAILAFNRAKKCTQETDGGSH